MLFGIMCVIESACGRAAGGAGDLSRWIDWGRDGWLRPRDMKAEEPILNIDCARLRYLSFVAPLQMEMGTVSTDAAARVNYGLDKGPLPCAGEGGCARPAARHIDGAGAGGGVVTRVRTSHH